MPAYFAVSELPDAIGICAGMQDTARESCAEFIRL